MLIVHYIYIVLKQSICYVMNVMYYVILNILFIEHIYQAYFFIISIHFIEIINLNIITASRASGRPGLISICIWKYQPSYCYFNLYGNFNTDFNKL